MAFKNFKVETDADGIALVTWDIPGRSMNVLDEATLGELQEIVKQTSGDAAIKGVVLLLQSRSMRLSVASVLILGGFESIPGAIVGGLIIGASEKLAEVYIGPYVGGGIEGWFPYVLALLFLLVRPEGLFGEKHIDRV